MTHPLAHPATPAALKASGFTPVGVYDDILLDVVGCPMLRRGDTLLAPSLIREGMLVMQDHTVAARLHGTLELLAWLAENPPRKP